MNLTSKFVSTCQRVCTFLIIVIFALSCNSTDDVDPKNPQNNQQQNGNDKGDAAPNFELKGLDGSTFKLSEQSDKVVVLFFLGSTCPSCRAVAPDIEEKLNVANSKEANFAIVGLDQWDGTKSAVQSFKDVTKVTFPLLLDASGVASEYKTTYDRLIVVDKKGKIAHMGSRAAANDISTVVSTVNELLDNM